MEAFEPNGCRVLIRPTPVEKRTDSGLYLPDTAQEQSPGWGTILAVGPGRETEAGLLVPMKAQVGETVYYPPYSGTPVIINRENLLVMYETELLGTVRSTTTDG